ncbi:hypothetical protein DSBG_4200 [Desulfosporosinus sp. BG]|nr:hypothetical protein DSBG_4200 [Desulfosporosinus sp. BG]
MKPTFAYGYLFQLFLTNIVAEKKAADFSQPLLRHVERETPGR